MGLRTRKNITIEEHNRMKELEAAGIKRRDIATRMQCSPGCVTRRLGAKRAYKVKEDEVTTE